MANFLAIYVGASLCLTKMIHAFLKKKLASSWGAPQENDAKFRFAIHPQGIRQFHDNWVFELWHINSCRLLLFASIGAFVQSRFLGSRKLNSLIDSTGLSHKFTVDKSLG